MDQKTIQTGGILSGILLIFCGIMVSPVAIGLTLSYPHELWWLGGILCVSCFLMIYGGIQSLRTAKRQEKMANAELSRIVAELSVKKPATETQPSMPVDLESKGLSKNSMFPSPPQYRGGEGVKPDPPLREVETVENKVIKDDFRSNNDVLASWTFTQQEWNQFMRLEKRRRRESSIYEAIGFTVLGTIVIMLARESTFMIALTISTIIGAVISGLRYLLTMKSYGGTLPETRVTITQQSILINDKLNPYRSETFWLDKLEYKEGNPDVLEFTHAWSNRKNKKMFDEMRIPVPTGKREEAQRLIQKILNSHT